MSRMMGLAGSLMIKRRPLLIEACLSDVFWDMDAVFTCIVGVDAKRRQPRIVARVSLVGK